MPQRRFCFISMNSNILFEEKQRFSGGAEYQQFHLAHYLREQGWEIHYITAKIEKRRMTEITVHETIAIQNFSSLPMYKKLFRFFQLNIKFPLALINSRADYVYQRGYTAMTVLTYFWSKVMRKRMIFHVASNKDLIPSRKYRGKLLNWFMRVIKRTSIVIAQTKLQHQMLNEMGVTHSHLIPNFLIPGLSDSLVKRREIVLWVGGLRPLKRPDLFLDLVEHCPDIQFVMIGPDDLNDEKYSLGIREQASKFSNLRVLPFTPPDKLDAYFERAICFVSTSEVEGFPNVFLQSWLHGVPVVSFHFPIDAVIVAPHSLGDSFGMTCNDLDEILRYLSGVQKGSISIDSAGLQAYVKQHYSLDVIGQQIVDVLEE